MNKFYLANVAIDRDMSYKKYKLKSYTKSNFIKRTIRDTNNTTDKVFEMNFWVWVQWSYATYTN